MSTLTVQVLPGYSFSDTEILTPAIIRLIAAPTVNIIGVISTASIVDGSVTNPKLAANAVGSANIIDLNVTTSKLALLAVTAAQIALATITAAQIAAATITAANMAAGVLVYPVTGDALNLVVGPNGATPLTKMTVTASELILTAAGVGYKVTTVNVTADVTVNGANGLDAGSVANNVWYYLYVITDGTTVSALLSTSKTAPTMPGAYTYKALVGAVLTDGSAHFADMIVYGKQTRFIGAPRVPKISTAYASIGHNLGAIPTDVQWVLRCVTGEANYVAGDEIPLADVVAFDTAKIIPAFGTSASATNVFVALGSFTPQVMNKTTFLFGTLALTAGAPNFLTNWMLVCYATL